MDERLNLALPDDNAANAPAKRFEAREEPAKPGLLSKASLPFLIIALGSALKRMFGSDAEATEIPDSRLSDQATPAVEVEDVSPVEEQPAPTGDNVVDLTPYLRALATQRSANFRPSEFQFQSSEYELPDEGSPPAASSETAADYLRSFSEAPAEGSIAAPSGVLPAGGAPVSGSDGGGGNATNLPLLDDDDDDDGDDEQAGKNRRPTVNEGVTLNSALLNTAMIISASELLVGASDADGQTLTVSEVVPDRGTVTVLDDGRWQYLPAEGEVGPVTFQYRISDGVESIVQTAELEILLPPGENIVGTDEDELHLGTPAADVIDSRGGNDNVFGDDGDDTLYGGDGDDHLVGGDGNDAIWGGAGNDTLAGGDGDDQLFGGDGDDDLDGGAGDDVLAGGAGDDEMRGGAGDDILEGGAGQDVLGGDAGSDILYGGSGDDMLAGGSDDDHLFGNAGDDEISGDDGADLVLGDGGADRISGGAGDDDLYGGDGNDDISGGDGDDYLQGDDGDDRLAGGLGANTVDGGAGDDRIVLSADGEIDVVLGGSGSDTIDLGDIIIDSTIDLPDGRVIIDGIETAQIFEVENIHGGFGRDRLVADGSTNIMVGGEGNDRFVFPSLGSLTNDGGPPDHIMDFATGDRIDLSRVTSDPADFGAIRLFFRGAAATDVREIGAITFEQQRLFEGEEVTVIASFLSDDEEATFEIVLQGHHDLSEWSFVLDRDGNGHG